MPTGKSYMALPFDVLDDAEDLTDEELGSLIRYMARYAETGEESGDLTGAARFMRRRVVNTVDRFAEARNKRTQAGAKGGKANASKPKQTEANASKPKQTEANASKPKPNTETETETKADTETKEKTSRAREGEDSDWVEDFKSRGLDVPAICSSVCHEFNHLTGSRYSPEARYITDPVIKLLREGYTESDLLTVIRKKFNEWKDTEMRGNVKPMTVFNPDKFGEYLAQPEIVPQQKKSRQRRQMEVMAAAISNPFESEVIQIDSG